MIHIHEQAEQLNPTRDGCVTTVTDVCTCGHVRITVIGPAARAQSAWLPPGPFEAAEKAAEHAYDTMMAEGVTERPPPPAGIDATLYQWALDAMLR